jgi:hypothetical protein
MAGVLIDDVSLRRENILSIHLESKDLINIQQMEVAINGPDGATHLILCAGVANLGPISHETYTFLVGPQLSQCQFVGAIASDALSGNQASGPKLVEEDIDEELGANLISMDANYDDESGQVKLSAEVTSSITMTKVGISYNVSILAELPIF